MEKEITLEYLASTTVEQAIRNYKSAIRKPSDEKHRTKNFAKIYEQNLAWKNRNPWFRGYKNASTRCLYDVNSSYYKRCVPFTITLQDVKAAWFDSKAYEMEQPSIDRKDPNQGYIPGNIQFKELDDNRRGKRSCRWKKNERDI